MVCKCPKSAAVGCNLLKARWVYTTEHSRNIQVADGNSVGLFATCTGTGIQSPWSTANIDTTAIRRIAYTNLHGQYHFESR